MAQEFGFGAFLPRREDQTRVRPPLQMGEGDLRASEDRPFGTDDALAYDPAAEEDQAETPPPPAGFQLGQTQQAAPPAAPAAEPEPQLPPPPPAPPLSDAAKAFQQQSINSLRARIRNPETPPAMRDVLENSLRSMEARLSSPEETPAPAPTPAPARPFPGFGAANPAAGAGDAIRTAAQRMEAGEQQTDDPRVEQRRPIRRESASPDPRAHADPPSRPSKPPRREVYGGNDPLLRERMQKDFGHDPRSGDPVVAVGMAPSRVRDMPEEDARAGFWGMYYPGEDRIEINRTLPPPLQRETARHEMYHRGLAKLGYPVPPKDADESDPEVQRLGAMTELAALVADAKWGRASVDNSRLIGALTNHITQLDAQLGREDSDPLGEAAEVVRKYDRLARIGPERSAEPAPPTQYADDARRERLVAGDESRRTDGSALRAQQIRDIEQRLANPDLTSEERAFRERQLADLRVGQRGGVSKARPAPEGGQPGGVAPDLMGMGASENAAIRGIQRGLLRTASTPFYAQGTAQAQTAIDRDIGAAGVVEDVIRRTRREELGEENIDVPRFTGSPTEVGKFVYDQLSDVEGLGVVAAGRAAREAQYRALSTMGDRIDDEKLREDAVNNLLTAAGLQARAGEIPTAEMTREVREDFAEDQSLGGTLATMAKNPIATMAFLGETVLESAPAYALSAGTAALTRNPAAAAAALGAGTGALEYGSSVQEFLAEEGISLETPEDAEALLRNPDLLRRANERGVIRSTVIAAFEAAGQGVAARRLMESPIGDGIMKGVVEGLAGAGGEAAARAAAGQEQNAQEILFEGLAEMVAGPPVDVAVQTATRGADKRRTDAAGRVIEDVTAERLEEVDRAFGLGDETVAPSQPPETQTGRSGPAVRPGSEQPVNQYATNVPPDQIEEPAAAGATPDRPEPPRAPVENDIDRLAERGEDVIQNVLRVDPDQPPAPEAGTAPERPPEAGVRRPEGGVPQQPEAADTRQPAGEETPPRRAAPFPRTGEVAPEQPTLPEQQAESDATTPETRPPEAGRESPDAPDAADTRQAVAGREAQPAPEGAEAPAQPEAPQVPEEIQRLADDGADIVYEGRRVAPRAPVPPEIQRLADEGADITYEGRPVRPRVTARQPAPDEPEVRPRTTVDVPEEDVRPEPGEPPPLDTPRAPDDSAPTADQPPPSPENPAAEATAGERRGDPTSSRATDAPSSALSPQADDGWFTDGRYSYGPEVANTTNEQGEVIDTQSTGRWVRFDPEAAEQLRSDDADPDGSAIEVVDALPDGARPARAFSTAPVDVPEAAPRPDLDVPTGRESGPQGGRSQAPVSPTQMPEMGAPATSPERTDAPTSTTPIDIEPTVTPEPIDATPASNRTADEVLRRIDQQRRRVKADVIRQALPEIQRRLKKANLGTVDLQVSETLESQGRFFGFDDGRMTVVIGDSLNPANTVRHETIHVARNMPNAKSEYGVFNAKEWQTLVDEAERVWMPKYDVPNRYGDLSRSEQIEEAIAEAYGDFRGDAPKGPIKSAFKKLGRFLRVIRETFSERGVQTADDIFERLGEGALGRRRTDGAAAGRTPVARDQSTARTRAESQARIRRRQDRPDVSTALGTVEAERMSRQRFRETSEAGERLRNAEAALRRAREGVTRDYVTPEEYQAARTEYEAALQGVGRVSRGEPVTRDQRAPTIDQAVSPPPEVREMSQGFSPVRRRIFDLVSERPGIKTAEIVDDLYAADPEGGPSDAPGVVKVSVANINRTLRPAGYEIAARQGSKYSGYIFRRTDASDVSDTSDASDASDGPVTRDQRAPTFYSPLLRGVEGAKQKKAPAKDWKAILPKLPGVKKAEIDWLGVDEFLDANEGAQVTRDDLAEFVRESQVEVVEDRLAGAEGDVVAGYEANVEYDSPAEPDWDAEAEFYLDEARDEAIEEDLDRDPDDIPDDEIKDIAERIARERYEPAEFRATLIAEDADAPPHDGWYDREMRTYWFDSLGKFDSAQEAQEAAQEAWQAELARNDDEALAGPARFPEYTEPGGDNYREVLLRVPNLHETGKNKPSRRGVKTPDDPFEQVPFDPDQKYPFVQPGHFDEENIVVHARVKDRQGANGEDVLFIEEIQSDLASKWREATESPEITQRRRELEEEKRQATKDSQEAYKRMQEVAKEVVDRPEFQDATHADRTLSTLALDALRGYVNMVPSERVERTESLPERFMSALRETDYQQLQDRLREANQRQKRAIEDLLALGTDRSVAPSLPDTPFKEELTYTLMVKRMLREAAEKGYDKLSWTPGYMQAERWNAAAQSVVETLSWGSGPFARQPNAERAVYLEMAGDGGSRAVYVNDTGVIVSSELGPEAVDKPLSSLIGPSMAKQVMANAEGEVPGAKITFPDSGYAIAYDQQIKKAVDNLVKRYGGKVTMEHMRRSGTIGGKAREGDHRPVWSVDITPELREAASQPLSMFQRAPTGEMREAARAARAERARRRADAQAEQAPRPAVAIEDEDEAATVPPPPVRIAEPAERPRKPLPFPRTERKPLPFKRTERDARRGLLPELTPTPTPAPEQFGQGLTRDQRPPSARPVTGERLFAADQRTYDDIAEITAGNWEPRGDGPFVTKDQLGRIDRAREALQDRYIAMLRGVEEAETALGTELPDWANPYLIEETMSGRVGAGLDEVDRRYVEPVADLLAKGRRLGLTRDIADAYFTAMHAEERNRYIGRINPFMPGGDVGSGMTTAEARQTLADLRAKPYAHLLEAMEGPMQWIRDFTIDRRVADGLLSQQEADIWRKAYKFYVPLRGFAETDTAEAYLDSVGVGRGLSTSGYETKRAKGRTSRAFSPLANFEIQAKEVVIRGGKNSVGQAMYNLARLVPSDKWSIKKVEEKLFFNSSTGLVQKMSVAPTFGPVKQNEIATKIDGEEYRVVLHDPDLARAIGSVGAERANLALRVAMGYARYFSMMNTMLNPEFVPVNAARDIEAALINLGGFGKNDAGRLAKAAVKRWLPSAREVYIGIGNPDDPRAANYKRFVEAGGQVAFWQIGDPQEVLNSLDQEVRHRGSLARNAMRLVRPNMNKNAALQAVERVNLAVDNAVRLAVFTEALNAGWTEARAASLAKNLTVNFNRRGTASPTLNAALVFFNAAVQGTATLLRAMRSSKRVQAAALGLMGYGFLEEMLGAELSEEDDDEVKYWDKVNDYTSRRNFVIPGTAGEDRDPWVIPLSYGYNVFYYAGRQLAKGVRGVKSPDDIIGDVLQTTVQSVSPVDVTSPADLIPTAVKPAYDLAVNEDFFGSPIYPQYDWDPGLPDAYKHFGGVSEPARKIAQGLNRLTGGDSQYPGRIDINPEALDYLFEHNIGGAGRAIEKSGRLFMRMYHGEWDDITMKSVPVAGKLRASTGEWVDKNRFYRFADEVGAAIDRSENDEAAPGDTLRARDEKLLRLETSLKRTRKELKRLRNKKTAIYEDTSLDRAGRKAALDPIYEDEHELMVEFNRRYTEAVGPVSE